MQKTPRCQMALAHAQESLPRFGHSHVSSAHLVLGLLTLENGVAVNLLQQSGFSLGRVELYLSSLPRPFVQATVEAAPLLDPSAMQALERAEAETIARRHAHLGVECLLLGILAEEHGAAANLFASVRIDRDWIKRTLVEALQ